MAAGKTLGTNTEALASDMNTIGQWGTHAARPATGSVVAGSFYYETDTKKLFQEQNGSWVDVSGADLSTANAAVGDVVDGKTFFSVAQPRKTGTMAVRTLNFANDTVLAGYYAATTLSVVDADLDVVKIKKGITIFGFLGTYQAEPVLSEVYNDALAAGASYTPGNAGIYQSAGDNTSFIYPEFNSAKIGWKGPGDRVGAPYCYMGHWVSDGTNARVRNVSGAEKDVRVVRWYLDTFTYSRSYDEDLAATTGYTPAVAGYYSYGGESNQLGYQYNFAAPGWKSARDTCLAYTVQLLIVPTADADQRFYNADVGALNLCLLRAVPSA